MLKNKKPYLIIPKLIEQPTWGGDYIVRMKGWSKVKDFDGVRIGQSYELFSGSKLLSKITSTDDPKFIGELGSPDDSKVLNNPGYKEGEDFVNIREVTSLDDRVLLIKLNQSNGNSFQLHIKKDIHNQRWRPKPETWYYLEDGLVTFGIRRGVNLKDYKNACKSIEAKMKDLSSRIRNNDLSLNDARLQSEEFIRKINPWQYVNLHIIKKHSVVDPSAGGIHHSWEEDIENHPLGNVLYEIQKDVMDPVSTIRSFDKGKIKDDGTIREIHIDDYFKYLDTDTENNDIGKISQEKKGSSLIKNEDYVLDIFEIETEMKDKTNGSYSHLFVREDKIKVEAEDGSVVLSAGHSCFIPEN